MSACPSNWRGFPARTFGTAARAVVATTLVLAASALPAGAETDGPAQEIFSVAADLEPIPELCYLATCPPPRYAYGALPARFVPLGERLFFVADDRVHGAEPWVSDGTADGTAMLKDLCPGDCASVPTPLGILNGEVFFWANTPDFGVELWASDGTAAGTRRLTDLCPGPCGGYYGQGSWWNDEPSGELSRVAGATLGGELYFGATDGFGGGLYATDGSAAGTRLVQRTCSPLCFTMPMALTRVGDHLAFIGGGSQLWWSDGTTAGTRPGPPQCATGRLTQIEPPLLALGGRLLYAGACGGFLGTRPSVFDLLAVEPCGDAVSLAHGPALPLPAVHDGAVWAVLPQTGSQGAELWRSDGTPAGSARVSTLDVPPPLRLTSLAGRLLLTSLDLSADPLGYRVDLWRLDGAAAPQRLNDGSLSQVAPRAQGDRVLWWETPGFVDYFADVYDWRLVDYGDNLDGSGERRQVQLYRSPAVGPDLAPKQRIYPAFAAAGGHLFLSADGGDGQQLWSLPLAALDPPCGADHRDLCLQDGRFRVRVRYRNQHAGGAEGWATALPNTPESGFYWFFRPGNVELVVKVLDGTGVNGHHWVFWGGTTDLEYELEVTDLAQGVTKTYSHAPGDLCGGWDTTAFAASPATASAAATAATALSSTAVVAPLTPPPCSDDEHAVCLLAHGFGGGLYRVEVSFENQHAGGAAGVGTPVLFDAEDRTTAWFWFFRLDNPEVLVKVLDGTAVNGHPWVFVGGLTDVAYEVRVTAPGGSPVRTYRKEGGGRCGIADTTAFATVSAAAAAPAGPR